MCVSIPLFAHHCHSKVHSLNFIRFGLQLDKTMDKARCDAADLADLMGVDGFEQIEFGEYGDLLRQQTDAFSCGYWEPMF